MKIFTLALFGLILNGAFAQEIQNGNFESWDNIYGYDEPSEWGTFNAFSDFGSTAIVTKSTDAHGGQYAAKLSGGQMFGDTSVSIMWNGFMNGDTFDSGFGEQFSFRPDSLTGWFKTNVALLPDSLNGGYISISLTRWNNATGVTEVVGEGFAVFDLSLTYSRFSFPITYTSNAFPDTMMLQASSPYDLDVNHYLLLDDLSLDYTSSAGIYKISSDYLEVYPNPANTQLTLHASLKGEVNFIDAQGNVLSVFKLNDAGLDTAIDVSEFESGVYFLRTGSGLMKKVVIQH